VHLTIAAVGGFIGAVSFSGSLIAFAKLQGLITKSVRFSGQKFVNLAILLVTVALGGMSYRAIERRAGGRLGCSSCSRCCSASR
jgi:NAD/NADP transhydrogenase beta subunit